MKKPLWNVLVDAASLIVFTSMISTGLTLKYILPPGSGRTEMLLRTGGGRGRSIDVSMGLSRHEWGEIHFYISLAFLFLLIIHLGLHWNWIVCMTFGTKQAAQPRKRKIMAGVVILIILLILLLPWLGKKQILDQSVYQQTKGIVAGAR